MSSAVARRLSTSPQTIKHACLRACVCVCSCVHCMCVNVYARVCACVWEREGVKDSTACSKLSHERFFFHKGVVLRTGY